MDPDLVNGMKAGALECARVLISSQHGKISIVYPVIDPVSQTGLVQDNMRSQPRDEDLDLQLRYECILLGNSTMS